MTDTAAAHIRDASRLDGTYAAELRSSRLQSVWPLAFPVVLVLYLVYAWFAFDIPTLIERARLDRGVILATDSFAHKIHVEKRYGRRESEVEVSIEGTRTGRLEEFPAWVTADGDAVNVDLGEGYAVTIDGRVITMVAPGTAPFVATITEEGIDVAHEGPVPSWALVDPVKFEARPTLFRRVIVTRGRVQVHRYFLGWENFLFTLKSPFHGMSTGELVSLAGSSERVVEGKSNARAMFDDFWNNEEWQHGEVFQALLETIIMAVCGTMLASMVALPLAFAAARNFNPYMVTRLVVRRVFDFLRGIDNLIWSLIFIRAFGLGPLTGIMAIFFTDTGTLGKLFSEAIENIDDKQVEGVRSTGADDVQRYRFGVIPQILPVFVSQSLYYLESNTRSATVIGALGAGGIGLKLVETLRTGVDWENTLYIIILTISVVIAMDITSGWMRRKLIGGESR